MNDQFVGKRLEYHQISLAPPTPGIYAWYIDLELREADINDYEQTRENLFQLSEHLEIPRLWVETRGNLTKCFRGFLIHKHLAIDKELSEKVEQILLNSEQRKAFSLILKKCLPTLMAPIYIGVSDNLKQRLEQHRRVLSKGIIADKKDRELYSFAKEIGRRKISTNKLIVFIHVMPELTSLAGDKKKLKDIAEAAETILNRLFYPIIGRR